jgi:hypothetical protein
MNDVPAARPMLAALLALMLTSAPAWAENPTKPGECRGGDASFFRDEGLTLKVASKLQFNKTLLREKIQVKAVGGIVTLSGNVSSKDHIALAGKLAAGVEGVRCVNNFLKVGPPEPWEPPSGGG